MNDLIHRTEAQVEGVTFEDFAALLRQEAQEHDLPLECSGPESLWLTVGAGRFGVTRGATALRVRAEAESADWLFTLQESIDAHVEHYFPQASLPVWSNAPSPGAQPPNFVFARVRHVTQIAPRFLRVRLESADLARFATEDQIHFRLVQPSGPRTRWPVLSSEGRTQWPEPLHRPPYTVRAVDAVAGWLDTDVFVHEGGRTCAFAAEAVPGMQVGMMGPGGGALPRAERLLIGGDETAYPALARIIAAQAPESQITCHLFGRAEYDWPAHSGLTLVDAPGGEAALSEALRAAPPEVDRIWICTEKARVALLRSALSDWTGHKPHLGAYWTA